MLAVVPDDWIEERRRLGLDRREEMWDGWRLLRADDEGWAPLESRGLALRAAEGRLQVRSDAGTEEV